MAKKASGKAKGGRKPRAKAKTKPDVPGAKGAAAAPGQGSAKPERDGDEMRRQFLQFAGQWDEVQGKLKVVKKLEREVKVALKGAGFLVAEFVVRDELLTVKGEKEVSEHVALRLRVAKWIGHGLLGQVARQLDLFEAPQMSLADRAYDEGKMASMENRPAKPSNYAPDSEGYERYMEGYHDDQRRIAQGFKKPTTNGDGGEPGDDPEPLGEPPADTGDEPLQTGKHEAGERIPRSEWNARMKALGKEENGAPPGSRH